MKIVDAKELTDKLACLIEKSLINVELSACMLLKKCMENENNEFAKFSLDTIIKNNELASKQGLSACQDSGLAVLFVEVGSRVFVEGLENALNEGVRRGYRDYRKSVAHPLSRANTLDNTPAVIHYSRAEGESLTVTYLAKGAGAENMSKIYMHTPQNAEEKIIESVLDTVKRAGGNPCPPLVIGVGVGGTMEKAAILSKLALTRTTGQQSTAAENAVLEKRILESVNALNIGVQGLGGKNTALAVHLETFPTHIGMLPVAVNLQCHSVRHGRLVF